MKKIEKRIALKVANQLSTFRLIFNYFVIFFVPLLTEFWLRFECILTAFWPHFDCIFGCAANGQSASRQSASRQLILGYLLFGNCFLAAMHTRLNGVKIVQN